MMRDFFAFATNYTKQQPKAKRRMNVKMKGNERRKKPAATNKFRAILENAINFENREEVQLKV